MKKIIMLCLLMLNYGAVFAYSRSANTPPSSTAKQVSENAYCTKEDFEMNLFSDKEVYKSTDIIHIWATLQYMGNEDTITIWHGIPYMVFSITDGEDFNSSGIVQTLLTTTTLDKGRLYHFDYQKSGGWSASDPSAGFWEDFYNKKELFLPPGEYTIAVRGAFSLSESVVDSPSELICELKIRVEQ